MSTAVRNRPSLYDSDFHAWTQAQARALAERRAADVDWANVAEEIDSLGRSDRRSIASHLEILIAHLLKWRHQPDLRGRSWDVTIYSQRKEIAKLLHESPSLRDYPAEVFDTVYPHAVRLAEREAVLYGGVFPASPPFTVEQALDDDFRPSDLD